ncbi:endo-1,4-beta-xylanase 5-like isoform X2 [Trifolium pratense]|uniref:endo-1,4-beta-xylanase 5-like isoform X2 n=1 Tax=Trifolium pratense TaxID=57577 RepID=UPI001E697AE7|nr:endo-1,4-beta-xylanase 5-like isoform X2 [Trifolium pratense]
MHCIREVLYNIMMISDKMKVAAKCCNLFFTTTSFLLLISGVHSLDYDYSATIECMKEPQRAQYGGGIIVNSEFEHNIEGWTVFGNGKIEEHISNDGNRFIVVRNRTQTLDSFSQNVQLKKGLIYMFSAWFQLSEGSDIVSVLFKINGSELVRGGHVIAKQGCWSLLKGGIVANFSSSAEILFESENPTVELWADSVSLQPFTIKQWRSHQDKSIERVRKSKVRFQVTHLNETALEGATVVIKQTKPNFPFGCAMNKYILTNYEYQKWFVARFKYTTFTNEMKWYSTEQIQGQENYTIADAMLKFAKENGISVRGHTIFWDCTNLQPGWVKFLSPNELREAAAKRMNSVVSRYNGQLIAWDVVNENLHCHFYEDKFGENISAKYYSTAYHLDPKTTMFMNEYNTIEYSGDHFASPANYIRKLKEIWKFPGTAGMPMGIGVQGHFAWGVPNLAYMRSGLDLLGATGLPIWLTETSVKAQPNQAQYLEEILREAFSHPAVQGIIMFVGPAQAGFRGTVLADAKFQNTPSGDVVDKLINEWGTGPKIAIADSKGIVDISLHHGDYDVTVTHPLTQYSKKLNVSVRKGFSPDTIHVKMHA